MAEYYVEKQSQENGEHMIHSSTCTLLPEIGTLNYLGSIATVDSAIKKAYERLTSVGTCSECIPSQVDAA